MQTLSISQRLFNGEVFDDKCPTREILNHVTNKWGCLAMVVLLGGTMRYSELRRNLRGISEKMLAQTLQTLEKDGLVLRISYPVIPPHVEYSLTPLGQSLAIKLEDLLQWVGDNAAEIIGRWE